MTVPDNKTDSVSIEEIGWLFVKNYYGTYTSELQKLYGFYDKNASLLHDAFPSESSESEAPVPKTVHLANGTESIQKHFLEQSNNSEKNKIVIERADFQSSVENSILIVVCGSWKRGSSSLWQFVQTFVLKPAGTNLFDVANDMLKFVDLSESFEQPLVVVQQPETPNGKAPVEAEKPEVESASEADAEVSKATKDDAPLATAEKKEEEVVNETVPKVTPKEEKASKKPAAGTEETKDAGAESAAPKKDATPTSAPAQPAAPAPKPTWANLAAMQPKVPTSKTATVSSPGAAKNVPAPSPTVKKPASPAQGAASNQQQPQQQQSSKSKKEEWYPIYIRDADVDEEQLRSALTKTFGEMKFFKKNQRVALCDFKEKEFQQKALEAKELTVGNVVVHLEPRTHKQNNKKDFKDKKAAKKNNNYNNGNGHKKN